MIRLEEGNEVGRKIEAQNARNESSNGCEIHHYTEHPEELFEIGGKREGLEAIDEHNLAQRRVEDHALVDRRSVRNPTIPRREAVHDWLFLDAVPLGVGDPSMCTKETFNLFPGCDQYLITSTPSFIHF